MLLNEWPCETWTEKAVFIAGETTAKMKDERERRPFGPHANAIAAALFSAGPARLDSASLTAIGLELEI